MSHENCEKRRKYAWGKYFKLRSDFMELALITIKNGINEDVKRVIKNMFHNQLSEDKTCVICLEEMKKDKKIVMTSCAHFYHKECLEMAKENGCPICRREIKNEYEL